MIFQVDVSFQHRQLIIEAIDSARQLNKLIVELGLFLF